MAGGPSTQNIGERGLELTAAMTTSGELAEFQQMATCPTGHQYPAAAGVCPYDAPIASTLTIPATITLLTEEEARVSMVAAGLVVTGLPAAFIASDVLKYVDNGKAPRWLHNFGYALKVGVVNHIPVCKTLKQLTDYFNGGSALGSTHFGVNRGTYRMFEWQGARFPVAEAHQYMPVFGPVAPWAQGVIACGGSCRIQCHPRIGSMRPGEPNGAFVSIENVDAGQPVPDDAQFNTNVLLRAWAAAANGFDITPDTQLWHSEIDRVDRCGDPPWSGAVEDEMQDAARGILRGDLSGLRAVEGGETVPEIDWTRIKPILDDGYSAALKAKQYADESFKKWDDLFTELRRQGAPV